MSKSERPTNKNLKVPTSEEARRNGRAGGIASARARRERKTMRETAEILLKMPMKNGKIDEISGVESLEEVLKKSPDGKMAVNLTLQDMTMIAMLRKAMKGDMKAMELIMELTGEKETPTTTSPLDGLASVIKQYEDDED